MSRRRWFRRGRQRPYASPAAPAAVEFLHPGAAWPMKPAHPEHRGSPVSIGGYQVYAGGTRDLRPGDLTGYDLVIPLTSTGALPLTSRERTTVLPYYMEDFGGVPDDWEDFLEEVIAELRKGSRIIAFCMGSHGRTGTFLASLIALLESANDTPDPIAAARHRHCSHAVETRAQAQAIFALRDEALPEQYEAEFPVRYRSGPGESVVTVYGGWRGLNDLFDGGESPQFALPEIHAVCKKEGELP